MDRVLFPSVRLVSSANSSFTSARLRRICMCKILRTLEAIIARVGGENAQRFLTGAIHRLFATFSVVFDVHDERAIVSPHAPKQVCYALSQPRYVWL